MESALKHKHMEKKIGSVRGQQATIDALIGNEHYPIQCLNQYIGQCVGHYSIKYQSSINQVMTNLSDR